MSENPEWYKIGVEKGWIESYEQELIRFLENELGDFTNDLKLVLVFTSLFVKSGHVYLPMELSPSEWAAHLDIETSAPGLFSDQPIPSDKLLKKGVIGKSDEQTPFVFEKNRIWINRYRNYENTVAQKLIELSSEFSDYGEEALSKTHSILASLFPVSPKQKSPDWQKIAVALAYFKQILFISGGPGTGKTTTIAKILALLVQVSESPLRIALTAPTGKAAARMGEALSSGLNEIEFPERFKQSIPDEAQTIHRLLRGFDYEGLLPAPLPQILPYDLIVIDEASMVDLMLMHRLLTHTGPDTRLILLGDKDQLSSVEAGAVFADICQKKENGFNLGTIQTLRKLGIENPINEVKQSSLDDSIVYLEKSWRFDESSAIGILSSKIKQGKREPKNGQTNIFDPAPDIKSIFGSSGNEDIQHVSFSYSGQELSEIFSRLVKRVTDTQKQPAKVLLGDLQSEVWLTVLRHGLTGSIKLNELTERFLRGNADIRFIDEWYHGRPVMIVKNNYHLSLYNGDIGVCILEEDRSPWVYFQEVKGGLKKIPAHHLNYIEPAYFLTVHKSQGSEFDRVNLMLPKEDTPILTKELLYTAVTRARKQCVVYGELKLFEKGIFQPTERFTGLSEKLQ